MPEIVTLDERHNPWNRTIHLVVTGITQNELRALWKHHGVRYKRCLQLVNGWKNMVITIFENEHDKTAAMILI